MLKKGFTHLLVLLFCVVALFSAIFIFRNHRIESLPIYTPTTTPSPTPIAHYSPQPIAKSEAYTIIFVGDSMIDSLGENFDALRVALSKHYPDSVFGLFNYGFGSTNILSAKQRLTDESFYLNKNYQAILKREMDIVVLGSFGYNPLSEFPLEEGLTKQTDALDDIVLKLVHEKPDDLIVFLAEIAPSLEKYGTGQVDLSPEKRAEWAQERRSYIENHINYAKSHNIPLINVYEKTIDQAGVADLKYISTTDYIHPSAAGVTLMSQEIADFLARDVIP